MKHKGPELDLGKAMELLNQIKEIVEISKHLLSKEDKSKFKEVLRSTRDHLVEIITVIDSINLQLKD